MKRGGDLLLTSAMVVAGIRLWLQVRGKAQTPFTEWAVGWGATFFVLSLMEDALPPAGGWLALIIAVSDFLRNGVSLTDDVSDIVTGATTGPVLTNQPFSTVSTQDVASKSNGTTKRKVNG